MNEKYENLAFYGTILVLKVMIMSLLTARQRRKNGALRSSEDAKLLPNNPDESEIKLALEPIEDVERVRRAHRNDLEVVFNFILVVFFAISSGSDQENILNCLRFYTLCRFGHSLFYLNAIQPHRAICNTMCSLTHYALILITLQRFIFV